ncbi:MAG: glutamate-cysteine ligase family protein, partial [Candidatus Woesearchaeota archaeon]|nr:glutamate-cysteine ligase family protein [Candidatus Woesearchaeota archaeon]
MTAKTYMIKADGILGDEFEITPNFSGRKFGPELEFFTLERGTLLPVNIQYEISRLPIFGTDVHFELPTEQVELTSPPSLDIRNLEERLLKTYLDVREVADNMNALVVPVSFMPGNHFSITNDERYFRILDALGKNGRKHTVEVASDQINVGADDELDAIRLYERFRRLIPVITGFGVSSPFTENGFNHLLSNRMYAYNHVFSGNPKFKAHTGFPKRFETIEEYIAEVQNLPLFQHPNGLYTYLRPMIHRGVAGELRSLDKQPTLKDYMAFVALVKGLVFNDGFEPKTMDESDFLQAIRYGIFDPSYFGQVLDAAIDGLPDHEKHYISPLCRRLELAKTPAQKMIDE